VCAVGEIARQPRVVLVTGGNRGIGAAIAQRFAAAGDRVVIGHRTNVAPDFSAEIISVNMDVTDPSSLDDAFSTIERELGPIEVLVANAGITNERYQFRWRIQGGKTWRKGHVET